MNENNSWSIENIKNFWEGTPCGEHLVSNFEEGSDNYFEAIVRERYKWEYHLPPFLDIIANSSKNGKLLEIGCGMGIDSSELVKRGCDLTAIDLTERGIELARKNFNRLGLSADFKVANAENLDFPDNSFSSVYSFGVLHHTTRTERAISEIYRVLHPGGRAFIMLYSKYSLNNLVHKILRAPYEKNQHPDFKDAPVVRMYSKRELKKLFSSFGRCKFQKRFLFGAGYKPVIYFIPKTINDLFGRFIGWHWLIEAQKP